MNVEPVCYCEWPGMDCSGCQEMRAQARRPAIVQKVLRTAQDVEEFLTQLRSKVFNGEAMHQEAESIRQRLAAKRERRAARARV